MKQDGKEKSSKPWTPPAFSKVGKGTIDLLKDDFPDSWKLEVETAAEHGLSFVTIGERKKKEDKKTKTSTEVVYAAFKPKFKQDAYGLEFKGTLDNESLFKSELTVADLLFPGLKATLKGEAGKTQTFNATFDFSHEHATVSASGDWKASGELFLGLALLVGHQGFSAGGQIGTLKTSAKNFGLDSITAMLNYKAETFDLSAAWKNELKEDDEKKLETANTLQAKLLFSPNKESSFATDFEFDLNKRGDIVKATKIKFGGTHKIDTNTTARARFDTEGKLGLSLSKQLNDCVNATIGTEINTYAITGDHKLGLVLKLKV